ncbi:MAG: carbohydrate-binding protein [Ignavibacteriae bacterium]|nr:MAG: carbohydrate-binding protein [Ignavibacteriota bacterium]
MKKNNIAATSTLLVLLVSGYSFAQNPIIRNQFTADPTARVFDHTVYVYPSHDITAAPGKGHPGWFCMEDYHVFSSSDLTDWTDHGIIVSQNNVPWVDSTSYSMWAPDCIYKNGKYYFYFPTRAKDTTWGRGFSIGVAISDHPSGPFIPQPEPLKNVHGIDPNVFIDKNGKAYLYWAMGKIYAAPLKENMLELASGPQVLKGLPEKGLIEGPFLFERNGKYYLTYPHVQKTIERLEYATSDNPMGPFQFEGVIMDESPNGCWTNHQSILNFKDQWYLFYHQNDLSPSFDKNRSIRIDSLFFKSDGTIQKVIPTFRGVGLTDASHHIEIDRYSLKCGAGAAIVFLDTLNPFNGWKTILSQKDAWVQYNAVDFGREKYQAIQVKARSLMDGILQIRLDKNNGPILAEVNIPKSTDWNTIDAPLSKFQPGIHNLVVTVNHNHPVEIDWVRFIK